MIPSANEEEVRLFFNILNNNKVEYLVIGGAAVNIHGYTRATGDLDIWYNPLKENFLKLLEAITQFGFDTTDLNKVTEYETKGFIRLPLQNFYIELLAVIDGKMEFPHAYQRAFDFKLDDITVRVIGYDDLIQNKVMSRRAKDLDDIAQLERIKKIQQEKRNKP